MDIRTLRKNKKWTQQKLADKMRVSLSTIKRWENGSTNPRTNDSYMLRLLLIENKNIERGEID